MSDDATTQDEAVAPPHTPTAAPPAPGALRALGRGLRRRCASCGGGPVLAGWGRLAVRCGTCGLWLERSHGMSMGSLGINTVVTFTTLFAVQVIGLVATWPDFAVGPLIALAVGWGVLFPVAFHSTAQTLWLAIDVAMRPVEPDELGDERPTPRA